jgi:hypothetical protein
MSTVLSDGKLFDDEELEKLPKQEVPHSPEKAEHDHDYYQDPNVICCNFDHLNQFQGLTNSVHSAPGNKNGVIQSQITKVKMKKMGSHVKVRGSETAYGEYALKHSMYRFSKAVENPSAISLICKQFKDSCGIRKLVSSSQNNLPCSSLETLPNMNGTCLRTDVHRNPRWKYFSCANDILTEESSPSSSCSISSDEDSDLPAAAFVNQQPCSHSDNHCAKLPVPFTDEAKRVFSHQDLLDGSNSSPPVTFLNSLSRSCAQQKDVTTPFAAYQHTASLPSENLTDARTNSSWPDGLKASDVAVRCEFPQPEAELSTSYNLTFSSACSSPDLAEYPELDGDLPGLPQSQ